MKENSIERDIHLLQSYAGMTHKMNDNQGRPKLDQAIEHILRDYKRVLKENEELKEKENKIYKEVQESLAFEKFLIVKERKPDLFNQGRFYISQIIYDILNDTQNPEGIHKENKCIQYIDYIPIQKVKEKIEELGKEEKRELKGTKGQDRYYIKQKYMYKRKVLEDLLREE